MPFYDHVFFPVVDCGPLWSDLSDNVILDSLVHNTTFNSTVAIGCDVGWEMHGGDGLLTATCLESGNWFVPDVTCTRK